MDRLDSASSTETTMASSATPDSSATPPLRAPPVPGKPYKYTYSPEQPPHEGYYPIHFVR